MALNTENMSFIEQGERNKFAYMNVTLQDIDKIPTEVLQQFRKTRKSMAIPEYLQRYILHLDKAAELFNTKGNINEICRELITAFPDDGLSFTTAKRRVYDAINFFHLNNTVRNEAWDMYYADRLEALGRKAELAFDGMIAREPDNEAEGIDDFGDMPFPKVYASSKASGKKFAGLLQEARRCYSMAHQLRTRRDDNALDSDALRPKDFLINPDISPERLGLKKQNLKQLWSGASKLINSLELEEEEKERLLKESAEVIDIDYEEITRD